MKTIEKVYQELSDPRHPVAIAMERQKTVQEVRITCGERGRTIEGLPPLEDESTTL